jgi:hypothetical protein
MRSIQPDNIILGATVEEIRITIEALGAWEGPDVSSYHSKQMRKQKHDKDMKKAESILRSLERALDERTPVKNSYNHPIRFGG